MKILQLMAFLTIAPWAVLVPAAALWLMWRRVRSFLILATALAWLLYGIYEALMYLRILCSGECNIRIDLLAIYPLLLLLTLVSVAVFLWRGSGRKTSRE